MDNKNIKSNDICDENMPHKSLIEDVKKQLPKAQILYDLAELFKIFGDGTRIRILYILFECEVCVCDIAEILGMTVSAVSHQLRILKNAKLVKSRRDGKTCYYSLSDNHVKSIIAAGTEHIEE